MVRRIGINVFQTVLLPTVRPNEIKRLNTDYQDLSSLHSLDVDAEIDRALAVAMPCVDSDSHQIHIVAEPLDVACNFAAWNREMQTESGQQLRPAALGTSTDTEIEEGYFWKASDVVWRFRRAAGRQPSECDSLSG